MLRWAKRLVSKQRELRMIWQIEKGGRSSLLVGSAHFFPYHFRGDLRRILKGATMVVLEGPLDEQAMRVIDAGAAARLAAKVRAGSQGAWGPVPMPPAAGISEPDL